MKKTLLCVTALVTLTFASSAFAADLPTQPVVPDDIPPAFSWTGFYVGVNAGYAFGMDKLKNPDVYYYRSSIYPLDSARTSNDGSFTGGVQGGYNYQMGRFVIGAETDFNYADLETKYDGRSDFIAIATPLVGVIPGAYTVAAKSKLEWFGTVRARVGFTPIDRLLVSATGGLAYGQIKTSMAFTDYFGNGVDGSANGSKSDTRVGWTLGAGAEYAITDHLSIRGEYAYVALGDKSHNWGFATNSIGPNKFTDHHMAIKDKGNFQIVRAGLNYKF